MSVVEGSSNGEDTHAPDDSVEETENSHCSTQTDEYDDGFIEPYLTAYHLGNLDAENPGEIASSQQEPRCQDASFSKVKATKSFDVEGHPRKLTVSTSGKIAVMFRGRRVSVYDTEGIITVNFLTDIIKIEERHEKTIPVFPHDVSFGTLANNDIWIVGGNQLTHYVAQLAVNRLSNRAIVTETDKHHGMVKVFMLNGMLERGFGWRQGLMYPAGITVNNDDSILVADSSTAYIYVYRDNGQLLFKFAGKGTNNGQLSLPLDICTDSSRHIIVADSGNRRIELFTSRGEFIRHIATDIDPVSIAVGPDGQLVLTETVRHRGVVKVFGLNGILERRFGRRQGLMYPTGITVDSEDSILVVDSSTAYIYVYRDNGQLLFKFAGKGTNNGQFSLPLDICTDSSRHIIVADSGNRRIELFTSHGEFIRHIATDIDPLSIAMGPDGQLVLAEASKKKVTILTNY
ncbi:PREDICTED: tripartite motif-containing protein 3-like [Branchiostoma belcheri]|uniref:Tripartite motif-containing protein 3-like n=1 Tax=Branchiostoma belcheri TaxID=7741 RepID=A0A6P5A8I6_BRABE|nr:PREDICTED: tripartite motif-containing protein 3-like [Branchiostoma belcheri]